MNLRSIIIALCGLALVGCIIAYCGWRLMGSPPPAEWVDLARQAMTELVLFLQRIPAWLYFVAFVGLPLAGVPLTVFYLTAVPVWGNLGLSASVALGLIAVALNMSLGYWIAAHGMRPFARAMMRKGGYEVPELSASNTAQVVLLVRLSPLPFVFQNYSLGLARPRFVPYLLYSMPVQALIGSGVMLVGESILEGGFRLALLGGFLFFLLFLGGNFLKQRWGGTVPTKGDDPD